MIGSPLVGQDGTIDVVYGSNEVILLTSSLSPPVELTKALSKVTTSVKYQPLNSGRCKPNNLTAQSSSNSAQPS